MSYHRKTTYVLDGYSVELDFEPYGADYGGLIIEEVGDRLLVAYLVLDETPINPMKDYDSEGVLYTRDRGVVTDDAREVYFALGLDSYGDVDVDREFVLQGGATVVTLRSLAVKLTCSRVLANTELQRRWFEYTYGESFVEGQVYSVDAKALMSDLVTDYGVFHSEVDELAISLYSQHWQAIAGPYVVPVYYCPSSHGPGTTTISIANWDGDLDDIPTGVWVADAGMVENIESQTLPEGVSITWRGIGGSLHAVVCKGGEVVFDSGPSETGKDWRRALDFVKTTYGPAADSDLHKTAVECAEGVLSGYESWCNGDVYGCVCQVFERSDTEWDEIVSERSDTWGYFGFDYAKQCLQSEYVDPVIKDWKSELTQGANHE